MSQFDKLDKCTSEFHSTCMDETMYENHGYPKNMRLIEHCSTLEEFAKYAHAITCVHINNINWLNKFYISILEDIDDNSYAALNIGDAAYIYLYGPTKTIRDRFKSLIDAYISPYDSGPYDSSL